MLRYQIRRNLVVLNALHRFGELVYESNHFTPTHLIELFIETALGKTFKGERKERQSEWQCFYSLRGPESGNKIQYVFT